MRAVGAYGGQRPRLPLIRREGGWSSVFDSIMEAERFYVRRRARIPGEGWGASRLEAGELVNFLGNIDLVPVNPQPELGATECLYPVEAYIHALLRCP